VRFVDTNVLVYSISTEPDERTKAERAREILSSSELALSTQVLQEFYVQSTRASRRYRLSHEDAVALIESWLRFTTAETTVDLMRAALLTRKRFRISYWDAAIIEAARALGCRILLSEDLSDGRDYDGVLVENPFRE
jgi:predicted nucleic acid-binding protein